MTQFSTRNAYYLRVSTYKVAPLFLYLDERHVNWMQRHVLDSVIADLRPKMKDLFTFTRDKKHTVHVERGDGYQYCYFLRNSSRTEVVLLKEKSFSLRGPTPPLDDVKPDMVDGELNVKDFKPDVSVDYRGFGTSMHQLVVIVEPYPPLPPSEYAPPASRLSSRSASVATARSRSAASRVYGTRASSVSLSVEPQPRPQAAPNMRNASRSASVATPAPNSRRGGTTPIREASSTPGPSGRSRPVRGATPLFLPGDTPFDQDEEDEEAHQAYLTALREGRVRLPSVSRPAGSEDRMSKSERRSVKRAIELDDEEEDEPEGMESLGERLVRSSQVEESVVRVYGGWEERGEGEDSAVMGREDPGE